MSGERRLRHLFRQLERHGWRVERRTRGWLAFPPDPEHGPVTIHESPSDYRSHRNLRAELRRHGYRGDIPRH